DGGPVAAALRLGRAAGGAAGRHAGGDANPVRASGQNSWGRFVTCLWMAGYKPAPQIDSARPNRRRPPRRGGSRGSLAEAQAQRRAGPAVVDDVHRGVGQEDRLDHVDFTAVCRPLVNLLEDASDAPATRRATWTATTSPSTSASGQRPP